MTGISGFERAVYVKQGARVVKGHLKIGLPIAQAPGGPWMCKVSLSIIDEDGRRIRGKDPLEALLHAIFFARGLIESHKSLGFVVWWLQEGDNACL